MAWVAVETFNSYSDGSLSTLNGGSGWSSGWTTFGTAPNVQGTTVYEGAKAISITTGAAQRILSSDISDSGVVYFAVRMGQNNGQGLRINLRNTTDGGRVFVQVDTVDGFGTLGNIALFSSGNTITNLVVGYAINTWYVIRLTFSVSGGTFSAATSTGSYQGGGSFGSESSTVNMFLSGNIRYFTIAPETGGGTYYVDYISPTDPLPSPSSPSNRLPYLGLLGVGQ